MKLDLTVKSKELKAFEESLRSEVVGQDDAIELVSREYQKVLLGLCDPYKPLTSMLFLGPTGVGKTLLVKSIAKAIHGNRNTMITVDCEEFQEEHQISRLLGAPPGYLGHKDTEAIFNYASLTKGWDRDSIGNLTGKGPQISVILFDEVEKAHRSLHTLLLGIMDKAELTDGKNMVMNLSRCMIFMTSNLGSKEINQDQMGFATRKNVEQAFREISTEATEAAKKKFAKEFTGRLEHMVVFRPLSNLELNGILDKELWRVYERVLRVLIGKKEFNGDAKNIFTLALTNDMRDFLLTAGPDKKHGARNLSKAIQKYVADPLTTIIANNLVLSPGTVYLDIQDGKTVAEFDPCKNDHSIFKAAVEKYEEAKSEPVFDEQEDPGPVGELYGL